MEMEYGNLIPCYTIPTQLGATLGILHGTVKDL